MKKILCVLIACVIALSLCSCSSHRIETDDPDAYIKYVDDTVGAEDCMPALGECGDYSSFSTTRKRISFIFLTETVGLFLSYDEEEYHRQKEKILSEYEFFQKGDEDLASDPDASVGGYDIRLVKREYPYDTRKNGLLIGVNDTERKLCYLFYSDYDMDRIEDLDDYIDECFYLD